MVIPVRLERTTLSLEGRCSIQLSYGTTVSLEVRFLYMGFTPCFQVLLWVFGLWGKLLRLRIQARTPLRCPFFWQYKNQ